MSGSTHSSPGSPQATSSLAFFPVNRLHLPHNNREYFLSREFNGRGWDVRWLRPDDGTNEGVPVEWPEIRFRNVDMRGRKYFLPVYLALKLRQNGVRLLWLSGWNIRDLGELHWMVRILRALGIRVVYDPVDPICEFLRAQSDDRTPEEHRVCAQRASRIYSMCELVVSVTPEMRDLLAENGAPEQRIVVGRWGTDADLFDPQSTACDLKERLGLEPSTFLVGWLGTMEMFKGLFEILLPVIEQVGREREDVHFVVAGRGTLEPEVREWANARPGLPITIMGSILYADAPSFTGSLDAYLVSTNPRTRYARSICPVKCFDALAMGTRLIVTRTPATEFLDRYDSVSVVDFEVDAFRDAILRCLDDWRTHGGIRADPIDDHSHQRTARTLADAVASLVTR